MSLSLFKNIKIPGATFQEFTESGTWVHPQPGVPYRVFVEIIGGGGGGGNGAATSSQAATGNNAGGGSAGQLGSYHVADMLVVDNQPVIVGAGGGGGAATNINTNGTGAQTLAGNAGLAGGFSSFGFARANGGAGGAGGTVGAASPYTGSVFMVAAAIFRSFLSLSTSAHIRWVTYAGASGATKVSGVNAGGGGGGASIFGAAMAPKGGDGAAGNNAYVSSQPGDDGAPTDYGAAGGGGGAATNVSAVAGRTVTAQKGGNGGPGVVRVWSWPA